ncbi:MAG TPA: PadR family transcriptional regulator [Caulobacteraceae bacterium]|jgi:DNA-binding PadR family transcriptional regulator
MNDQGSKLDTPACVVLGMVRLGARSGYEIKQLVDSSIRFFWTISQAQIYPSLERLERDGLIEGRSEPLGKRRRRIFEITEAGETELRAWLRRDEPLPFELRDVGLLKLFFADALAPSEAQALLAEVKRRSLERVASLKRVEPAADFKTQQGNVHPLLTLRMGIAFHEAMIGVCEDFEHRLARLSDGTEQSA